MVFKDLPDPIIFAHRGASAYAPENTLAAFQLAIRQGADALEMDVKLTADHQAVVIHDRTLERTTGVPGRVAETTLAEIRKLDAGSHFDVAFHSEPIPTLDEVLEAVGQTICINIELTNYASITDDLPEVVAQIVQKHNLAHRVLFSSFNPLALIRVRRKLPRTPVGLLALIGKKGSLARSWPGYLLSYRSLHINFEDATFELVRRIRRRGCRVFCYVVNRPEDFRRLMAMGVSGFFTDDPVLARQTLKSGSERQVADPQ